jgi:simple sugar transport system substrate-binding protein
LAILAAVLVLGAAGCSSTGGKKSEQQTQIGTAGKANTPRMKFAMVTHAPSGDTFFDTIRKGAEAAAAKDNVQLVYSGDNDATKQANYVQSAIDAKVDGIAMTFPNPEALTPVAKKAVAAGIPVVGFNAGDSVWQSTGALMYFGEPEELSGEAVGNELNKISAKHALCVEQAQGQVQLEARCAGLTKTFHGQTEKLYANGEDLPGFTTTVSAKLKQDPSIDVVVTLNSPHGIAVADAEKAAGSKVQVATFGLSKELIPFLQNGGILLTVDQQPFVQGYEAIDSLWLYKTNANVIGAGLTVATGPYIVDKNNVAQIAPYAAHGTR